MAKAQRWDVWQVDQTNSQKITEPTQPANSSKPLRMYVVIAEQVSRDVTICPITDLKTGCKRTEVELIHGKYERFLTKDSKVVGNSIYTFPESALKNKVGRLQLNEINALQDIFIYYLGL